MPNPNDTGFSKMAAEALGLDPAVTKEVADSFNAFLNKLPRPKTEADFDRQQNPNVFVDQIPEEEELPWVMNHHSTDYGVWVDYDGGRFKDYYALRLKNGSVVNLALPNADVWIADVLAGGTDPKGVVWNIHPGTTFKDDEVAQIQLVSDAYLSTFASHAATGVERIKRNRQMFRDNLLPTEDPKVTEPAKIMARHFGLYIGEEQIAGSHRNQLKGELFHRNEDGTWSYNFKAHVDFGAISGYNPKLMKLVKQFGAVLRFQIDTVVTIKSDDLVADQVITDGKFEVVNPGRRPDYDWAAYLAKLPPMVLRVHFSHSYRKN